jgi:excinuclease ABC subunit C
MKQKLIDTIAQLPSHPGVYQYFDRKGGLLYVGKANNLQKRVSSYFTRINDSPWTRLMIEEIDSIQVTEVKSELEALLLENSYIKTLRPKYNMKLKDDKTFPFLHVTDEKFPRFIITRQINATRGRYFGPYFSATYLRTLLKLVQMLYGVKTVTDHSYEARSTVPPQIGLGVQHLDNPDLYLEQVEAAIRFLTSAQPQIERKLKIEMEKASESREFEQAAILRDRLRSLIQLRQGQSLFTPQGKNSDYIGICNRGDMVSVYVLFERDGKIVNHKTFLFDVPVTFNMSELTIQVIDYIYIHGLSLPQEIIVETLPDEKLSLETLLSEEAGYKVRLTQPKRGEVYKRLITARDNAAYQLKIETFKDSRREQALSELKNILNLSQLPNRIEACDISNLGAQAIVGATVVFIDGKPDKSEYRKYKIASVTGQDDFASMRDLVFRRVSNKERPLPDLLLIDGGKGQLRAAHDALKLAGHKVPLVALAKREEELFILDQSEPIKLAHSSNALLLLMAMRDEVHRFGLQFHRKRRSRKLIPQNSHQIKKRKPK